MPSKAPSAAQRPTLVSMDFHKGEALFKLASMYPTLTEVIEELVQNAIDSEASKIQVKLNWKTRHFAVRDDGVGATEDQFSKALQSVALSIKGKSKLGQFGLGFISPLGKCERFTFTSCPQPQIDEYREWTFVAESIKAQHHNLSVPMRERPDIMFGRHGQWWRTETNVYGITSDKTISTVAIDDLKRNILTKYSNAMRRNKVQVQLVITSEDGTETERKFTGTSFTGQALPVIMLNSPDTGRVEFRFYITNKRKTPKGTVNIQFGEIGNDFRFSFANFARGMSSNEFRPSDEIMDALKSGILEGEILAEKVKLNPSRTNYVNNDALNGLCLLLIDWYHEHAEQHYKAAKNVKQGERYQNLALKSLQSLEQMLKGSDEDLLGTLRQTFAFGTIGTGHAPPANRAIGRPQPAKALSTRGGAGRPRKEKGGEGCSGKPSDQEIPQHVPFSAQGPKGQYRNLVRSNSLGIQFAHDTLGDSDKLWILDRDAGVLLFNITHPLWVECDETDWMICALQENIMLQVLILESMPPDFKEHNRLFADQQMRLWVQWLTSNKVLSNRAKGVKRRTG